MMRLSISIIVLAALAVSLWAQGETTGAIVGGERSSGCGHSGGQGNHYQRR